MANKILLRPILYLKSILKPHKKSFSLYIINKTSCTDTFWMHWYKIHHITRSLTHSQRPATRIRLRTPRKTEAQANATREQSNKLNSVETSRKFFLKKTNKFDFLNIKILRVSICKKINTIQCRSQSKIKLEKNFEQLKKPKQTVFYKQILQSNPTSQNQSVANLFQPLKKKFWYI